MVRWNGNNMCLEVMDANGTFGNIPISIDVMLLSDTVEVIQWARIEMWKRKRVEGLRQKYSSLDEALKNVEIISALIDDEEGIMPSMMP
jgi:hypothetical protein